MDKSEIVHRPPGGTKLEHKLVDIAHGQSVDGRLFLAQWWVEDNRLRAGFLKHTQRQSDDRGVGLESASACWCLRPHFNPAGAPSHRFDNAVERYGDSI